MCSDYNLDFIIEHEFSWKVLNYEHLKIPQVSQKLKKTSTPSWYEINSCISASRLYFTTFFFIFSIGS